ncbi:MAG: SpoIIIAH-like family protein, partial [Niameybacter sp.]
MFQFKRNQIIVTVLVFMIAIAAYLSLTEAPASLTIPDVANNNEAMIPVAEADLDNDFFDDYGVMETLPPDDLDAEVDASVEVSMPEATVGSKEVVIAKKQTEVEEVASMDGKTVEVTYFAEEKMLREQARAAQIEQLTEYVSDPNLDKDTKSKAAENLISIQERIEKESGAESLLRAKG